MKAIVESLPCTICIHNKVCRYMMQEDKLKMDLSRINSENLSSSIKIKASIVCDYADYVPEDCVGETSNFSVEDLLADDCPDDPNQWEDE